jgi:hypothetical protein
MSWRSCKTAAGYHGRPFASKREARIEGAIARASLPGFSRLDPAVQRLKEHFEDGCADQVRA